jgi:organic hydroperoxide reductase OsmC/OhrA
MDHEHQYATRLTWDGNRGEGTSSYESYGREYHIDIDGKPVLHGSSDPAFRGDPARLNPEDMFVASLSACHLLTYLALCAKHGIRVLSYEDRASGTMRLDRSGGGRFAEVILHPRVTIADASQIERARSLHDEAHTKCFIASSCSIPVRHVPEVTKRG